MSGKGLEEVQCQTVLAQWLEAAGQEGPAEPHGGPGGKEPHMLIPCAILLKDLPCASTTLRRRSQDKQILHPGVQDLWLLRR